MLSGFNEKQWPFILMWLPYHDMSALQTSRLTASSIVKQPFVCLRKVWLHKRVFAKTVYQNNHLWSLQGQFWIVFIVKASVQNVFFGGKTVKHMKMCFNIHTAQLLVEVFLIYRFPSLLTFHFKNILFIIVVVSTVTLSHTGKKHPKACTHATKFMTPFLNLTISQTLKYILSTIGT